MTSGSSFVDVKLTYAVFNGAQQQQPYDLIVNH
jgi:hypothetical protein